MRHPVCNHEDHQIDLRRSWWQVLWRANCIMVNMFPFVSKLPRVLSRAVTSELGSSGQLSENTSSAVHAFVVETTIKPFRQGASTLDPLLGGLLNASAEVLVELDRIEAEIKSSECQDTRPEEAAFDGVSQLVEQIETEEAEAIRVRLNDMLLQWKEDWKYIEANEDEYGDFTGDRTQLSDLWFVHVKWADDWALDAEEFDWNLVGSLIKELSSEELLCLVGDQKTDVSPAVLRAALRALTRKEGRLTRCLPRLCAACLQRIGDGDNVEATGHATFRSGQVRDCRVAFIHAACMPADKLEAPHQTYWSLSHSELLWSIRRRNSLVSRPSLRSCAGCGQDFWDGDPLVVRVTMACFRNRRLHEAFPLILHDSCWRRLEDSG